MDVEIQQALQSLGLNRAPETAPRNAPATAQRPSPPPPESDSPRNLPARLVATLGQLVDGDLPLQPFLEQLLPQLCQLFGGVGAVVWMRAHSPNDAIVGFRYQMDHLLADTRTQAQHQRLVQLAWLQIQPLLAEASGNPDNATGHPLLFAPIVHLGQPIALLEIALAQPSLGPTSDSPQPAAAAPFSQQRPLYLRAAGLVAQRVYGGLRRRMAMPDLSLQQAVDQLSQLTGEVQSLQQQIRARIEVRLQQYYGWTFASLAENQAFVKGVQQLLESHGLRVQCPECGHPAILRCMRIGNTKHGAFVFDHYLDSGRTFHGGPSSVPLIRLVPKPARRTALSNPA